VFQPGCPPSCCNFNFEKIPYSAEGMEKLVKKHGNEALDYYKYWKETVSNSIYNHDNETTIRVKFIFISLFINPIFGLPRIAWRIACLVSGDFFGTGSSMAKSELQLDRQKWSLDRNRVSVPPSQGNLYAKVMTQVLWQLAKNVVKIVTYPIAIVLLETIALFGTIAPLLSRTLFGMTENLWSRDQIFSFWPDLFIGDFMAPCMQPDGALGHVRAYQWTNPGASDDLNKLSYDYYMMIKNKEVFFSNELKYNLDLKDSKNTIREYAILVSLRSYKSVESGYTPASSEKIECNDRPISEGSLDAHNDNEFITAQKNLRGLIGMLKEIEILREEVIEEQIKEVNGLENTLAQKEKELGDKKNTFAEVMLKIKAANKDLNSLKEVVQNVQPVKKAQGVTLLERNNILPRIEFLERNNILLSSQQAQTEVNRNEDKRENT